MTETQAITPYDNAKYWVAQYEAVDDVKEYMDKAAAVEAYARRANDMEMEVKAAKARIRAERRMGELISQMDKAKGSPGNQHTGPVDPSSESRGPKTLAEMGVSYNQSSQAQKLAKMPEDEFEEALNQSDRPSTAQIIKKPHVAHNSGENEWYTPGAIIESARVVMGEIDLDPASSEIAQQTVKAKSFYTIADDGLSKDWSGRVWLNPPYESRLIVRFIEKLCASDVEAVVLVNNATETAWFQSVLERASAICLPKGRIRFLCPEGKQGAPLQGQAILYLGNNDNKFFQEFSAYGFTTLIVRV